MLYSCFQFKEINMESIVEQIQRSKNYFSAFKFFCIKGKFLNSALSSSIASEIHQTSRRLPNSVAVCTGFLVLVEAFKHYTRLLQIKKLI